MAMNIKTCTQLINKEDIKMGTGLYDKFNREIKIGDKVKLVLDSGEVRIFDVCFKTVKRTVKNHPDFVDGYSKVYITGVVFCWNGYDLFPCVGEDGESDVRKMEIISNPEKEDKSQEFENFCRNK